MNSIKDKLYSLTRKPAQTSHIDNSSFIDSILSELDARRVKNEFGEFLLREKFFPLNYKHCVILNKLCEVDSKSFVLMAKDEGCAFLSPGDLLFIDTETTGLAGGSGTYAFLVGIGFLENDKFRIKQYFMHSFEAEKALLWDLLNTFQKFKAFVSFNGKSYDIPLLRNRFILNRIDYEWEQKKHIDLLHSSRRFWKTIYSDNSLQGLEKNVLGFKRLDDIPGSEIPGRFFDYLTTKSAKNIKPIMQHNVMDILSMVSLIIIQNDIIQTPHESNILFDSIGLIKSYENTGRDVEAVKSINEMISEKKETRDFKLLLRSSYIYKRLKKHNKAFEIWKDLVENYHTFDPNIYIEIAKYKEHVLKDYAGAVLLLDRLQKRIELLEELGRANNWPIGLNEIKYRKERIIKKMKKLECD